MPQQARSERFPHFVSSLSVSSPRPCQRSTLINSSHLQNLWFCQQSLESGDTKGPSRERVTEEFSRVVKIRLSLNNKK